VIEEALRRLIERAEGGAARVVAPHHADPRWVRLASEGLVAFATQTGPPPRPADPPAPVVAALGGMCPGLPLARLLEDPESDRADR